MAVPRRVAPHPDARGSSAAFHDDWVHALDSHANRWLAFPEQSATTQVGLFEWVKAQQVVEALNGAGVHGARVLEYGCGSAGMSIFLNQRGYSCVGLDRSPAALAVAARNEACHTTDRALRRVQGDVLRMPLVAESVDVAMSYGLLEHFDECSLVPLLREVRRVLRPGGLFVADVVPGGFNARWLGAAVSFTASAALRTVAGRTGTVRDLRAGYFGHYFESRLSPGQWRHILETNGFQDVQVRVCRPFPPLALSGLAERAYVAAMRALMPLWTWFDRADLPLKHRWGWMYLVTARRSA